MAIHFRFDYVSLDLKNKISFKFQKEANFVFDKVESEETMFLNMCTRMLKETIRDHTIQHIFIYLHFPSVIHGQ